MTGESRFFTQVVPEQSGSKDRSEKHTWPPQGSLSWKKRRWRQQGILGCPWAIRKVMGRVRRVSGATVVRAIDRGKAKRGGSSLPWLILAAAHGCCLHTSGLEFWSCIIIKKDQPNQPWICRIQMVRNFKNAMTFIQTPRQRAFKKDTDEPVIATISQLYPRGCSSPSPTPLLCRTSHKIWC